MPSPAVSLRIRKFRRRFGITAPRVVVRTHLPWPWYAAGAGLLLVLGLAVFWVFMQRGEARGLEHQLDTLRVQVRDLNQELLKLRSTAGTEQSAVQMERSTQLQLSNRIKALELENAALKEDMRLFERLIPAACDVLASRRLEQPIPPGISEPRDLLGYDCARSAEAAGAPGRCTAHCRAASGR